MRHARLFLEKGDYWVEDLGSAEGTWLNGSRLPVQSKQKIVPGDRVEFGQKAAVHLSFRIKRVHNSVWQQLQAFETGRISANGVAVQQSTPPETVVV